MRRPPLPIPAPAAPRKCDLFGVRVSATDYEQVVAWACATAARGAAGVIDLMPVHGLVHAARDPDYRARVNAFDVVAPDGQPVRWALNRWHGAGLADRVYGPELMWRMCRAAAGRGIGIYLYGSGPDVIERLSANLRAAFPAIVIAGAESPPFRPLTEAEDRDAVDRINASGAGFVFIGLGCPAQELFASDHAWGIRAVQACVGAAFDFHAGTKRTAPRWMQRRGLEWLFRLVQEPGRLWRRYLVTNTWFVLLVLRRMIFGRLRFGPSPVAAAAVAPKPRPVAEVARPAQLKKPARLKKAA